MRFLPGRRAHARLPAADRAAGVACRPGRGVLPRESPLARAGRPPRVLAGGRARPGRDRAVDRGPAPSAGPGAARRREAVVPPGAPDLRGGARRGRARRRDVPGERSDDRASTGRARGRRAEARGGGGRADAANAAGAGLDRRRGARARPRSGRDRGDHLMHEHLEPAGDGRSGPARQTRRRAGPPARAVGEDLARPGLEGRDQVLRAGRAPELPR